VSSGSETIRCRQLARHSLTAIIIITHGQYLITTVSVNHIPFNSELTKHGHSAVVETPVCPSHGSKPV